MSLEVREIQILNVDGEHCQDAKFFNSVAFADALQGIDQQYGTPFAAAVTVPVLHSTGAKTFGIYAFQSEIRLVDSHIKSWNDADGKGLCIASFECGRYDVVASYVCEQLVPAMGCVQNFKLVAAKAKPHEDDALLFRTGLDDNLDLGEVVGCVAKHSKARMGPPIPQVKARVPQMRATRSSTPVRSPEREQNTMSSTGLGGAGSTMPAGGASSTMPASTAHFSKTLTLKLLQMRVHWCYE